MSVFAISDLHLPAGSSANKSMAVFGSRWHDHVARIERAWRAVVGEADTVVIPGDISWAMTFDEAIEDLHFIDSLPGKKILGKGNHDFWWTSLSKMRAVLRDRGIDSIDFLQNNSYYADGFAICGTRGWFADRASQADIFTADFDKLAAREAVRLDLSISSALSLCHGEHGRVRVFVHFPIVFGGDVCEEMLDVLKKYNVTEVYFGHIHSPSASTAVFTHDGINYRLISADALGFAPIPIR